MPKNFLEEGKNPGLGIRDLHKRGFTGKGVKVAIIDQKLRLTHIEYKDRIERYIESENIDEHPSMHGSAVSSLLCGADCGVAPEVSLYYFANKSGRSFKAISNSLNGIIRFNLEKSLKERIRVVSISIGYKNGVEEEGLIDFKNSVDKALRSGIFVFYITNRHLNFIGGGSDTDKDDPLTYKPALYLNGRLRKDSIIVPTDYRAYADYRDDISYIYEEKGGMSWAEPYLAGLAALCLQKNDVLNFPDFMEIAKKTVAHTKDGVGIINPGGIVDSI